MASIRVEFAKSVLPATWGQEEWVGYMQVFDAPPIPLKTTSKYTRRFNGFLSVPGASKLLPA
jgi:hypothetical protein